MAPRQKKATKAAEKTVTRTASRNSVKATRKAAPKVAQVLTRTAKRAQGNQKQPPGGIARATQKAPPQAASQAMMEVQVQLPASAKAKKQGTNQGKKAPPKVKKFKLKAPTEAQDLIVGKTVAFALFGERPEWLREEKLLEFAREVKGKKYLFGTTAKRESNKNGVSYLVEWETTLLERTKIWEPSTVFRAMSLAETLKEKDESQHKALMSRDARRILFEFPSDEKGVVLSSDDSDEDDDQEATETSSRAPWNSQGLITLEELIGANGMTMPADIQKN